MGKITGVVLCGGSGRRMGGDKALLEIDGEPLVTRVATRLGGFADPVLLAPGLPRLRDVPYDQIADARADSGPLGGIVAALRAMTGSHVAVVAVDMPFVSPSVFELLAVLGAGADVVVPRDHGGLQPLHALYSADALPRLERALDEERFSVLDALRSLEVRVVTPEEWGEADPTGRFAFNLNTPGDLAELHPTD